MSKAFDSLHHSTLLAKLHDVGASTTPLQWFRSYLSSRHQVVRINSTLSVRMQVRNGVPQGSILGPLFLSIYVNDLPSIPHFCSPQCYVDDTKLLISFAFYEERGVRDKINQDLLKVRNWCFNNQLLLNPDKMKLMIFGSRQNIAKVNDDFNLSLFRKDLVPATTAKDLGIYVDSNLKIKSTKCKCPSGTFKCSHAAAVFIYAMHHIEQRAKKAMAYDDKKCCRNENDRASAEESRLKAIERLGQTRKRNADTSCNEVSQRKSIRSTTESVQILKDKFENEREIQKEEIELKKIEQENKASQHQMLIDLQRQNQQQYQDVLMIMTEQQHRQEQQQQNFSNAFLTTATKSNAHGFAGKSHAQILMKER
ncbi:putative RNA-directed DNA polymerase from transposon BS [Stylophora pistillata]|uniref:Putative RNA-directed DNA polymerase from transposon BS n=1 Tax=Stylophora pistillata TaxID=50429 RepID=A0A2B4R2T3_STYPI|nr:putative RNA-directed DNA polymerase from transposon BS [Stylophora pistillata]